MPIPGTKTEIKPPEKFACLFMLWLKSEEEELVGSRFSRSLLPFSETSWDRVLAIYSIKWVLDITSTVLTGKTPFSTISLPFSIFDILPCSTLSKGSFSIFSQHSA